jgi:queuosine precursor transporter
MLNEFIFLIHTIFVSSCTLIALYLGRSALIVFICVQSILANSFILKQATLFGLNATCTDVFTISGVLGLNLLQEYYGKEVARKAIWINFFLLIFYTAATQFHLWYLPAPTDSAQPFFELLLHSAPRIVVASLFVFLLVQHFDSWLYGNLKRVWNSKHLVLRNYISVAISQLIDTVLFSYLGLYGLIDNIGNIIIISYIIKLVAIVIATPIVTFSKRFFIHKGS